MASENAVSTHAGTHKDPVTGEMISKQSVIKVFFCPLFSVDRSIFICRELKRREKHRAKAPAAAAAAASINEDDLSPNVSRTIQNMKKNSFSHKK